MPQKAQTTQANEAQRIQVSLARTAAGKRVHIEIESYDAVLGWYTSGSVVLPLQQLPILQQAIDEMRHEPEEDGYGEIIAFPGKLAA